MSSPAVPFRLLSGGASGAPSSRRMLRSTPSADAQSVGRTEPGAPVDLAVRRRAAHLGELRAILAGIDSLWTTLWRVYPGRESEVVDFHLRFDGLRDAVVAWACGASGAPDGATILMRIDAQLEGALILGVPTEAGAAWRSLCHQLEQLEDLVTTLDLAGRPRL